MLYSIEYSIFVYYWFVAFEWQDPLDGHDEQELQPCDFLVNILNSIIAATITIAPPIIYSIEALLPKNKLATVVNINATTHASKNW